MCGHKKTTIFIVLTVILIIFYQTSLISFKLKRNTFIIKQGKGQYILDYPNGTNKKEISWSQSGQDLYVDKLLHKKRDGFFVEIGAYDGEIFSDTLFFEKERGWTGLLIEANPYSFDLMLEKMRKSYMVNACISKRTEKMTFELAGPATGIQRLFNRKQKQSMNTFGGMMWADSGEIKIQCYPLHELLQSINHLHIDYLSIDTEGSELFILESIDWNKLSIDVFKIDMGDNWKEILQFMRKHGYIMVKKIKEDVVFKKIKH